MNRGPLARRCRDLIEAEVDGELVAMDAELGLCFGFNRTAARVWALIEQPKCVAEICAALCEEFDIPPEGCRKEVLELLHSLRERGLVALD